MSLPFADLTYNPFAEFWFSDSHGRSRLIRPLRPRDADAFSFFLSHLTEKTRHFFEPHPLTWAEGQQLALESDPADCLRLVLIDIRLPQQPILGYLVLQMGLRDYEQERFDRYGIEYDPRLCVSLAPVIAEGWRAQGLGAPLLKQGLHLCRELGRQAVILMGGVQDNNRMAVRFYLRHGFHRLDSFEWPQGVLNDDMIRWL